MGDVTSPTREGHDRTRAGSWAWPARARIVSGVVEPYVDREDEWLPPLASSSSIKGLVASRAAVLGGDRALDRDHGADGGDGAQRHRAGQLIGRAVPLAFIFATVGVRFVVVRLHPAVAVLQPRRLGVRVLGVTLGPRAGFFAGWALLGTYIAFTWRVHRRGRHFGVAFFQDRHRGAE